MNKDNLVDENTMRKRKIKCYYLFLMNERNDIKLSIDAFESRLVAFDIAISELEGQFPEEIK